MTRWNSTLESYSTPGNFADDATVERLESEVNEDLPFLVIRAPGFTRRHELMKKLEIKSGCFLCDTIAQSMTCSDNLILPFDTYQKYVLVPNRFPMVRGNFLLISKVHDPSENKVNTTLTEKYLSTIKQISQTYGLLALRNHARAGMSIPNHEHTHLLPQYISTTSGEVNFCPLTECQLQESRDCQGVSTVSRTQWDTMAFTGDRVESKLVEITNKFEERGVIFTFAYSNSQRLKEGAFFLTPHKKEGLSSGYPVHHCQPEGEISYSAHRKYLKEYIYTKGEFPWKDFLN
jgi:hypothetical protein